MPLPVPPSRRVLPGLSPEGWQLPLSPPRAPLTQARPGGSGISGAGRAALNLATFTAGVPQETIPLASHRLLPTSIMHRGLGVLGGPGCFGAGAMAAKGCLLIRRQLRGPGLLVQGIWQLGQQSPGPFRGGLAAPRGGKRPT